MKVAISQPMFFPWVGMLELIRLADIFVDYSDVQFSKNGFTNRVQIKTAQGPLWLTVPLRKASLSQRIDEVAVDNSRDWRGKHLATLQMAYARAPHGRDMLELVEQVYADATDNLAALSCASTTALCDYFGITAGTHFIRSDDLFDDESGSARVLSLVQSLGGDCYITGWGAKDYLLHENFELAGVSVEYMNYRMEPYPQLHGEFTPYVSALDLIANLGRDGATYICSGTLPWREFLATR